MTININISQPNWWLGPWKNSLLHEQTMTALLSTLMRDDWGATFCSSKLAVIVRFTNAMTNQLWCENLVHLSPSHWRNLGRWRSGPHERQGSEMQDLKLTSHYPCLSSGPDLVVQVTRCTSLKSDHYSTHFNINSNQYSEMLVDKPSFIMTLLFWDVSWCRLTVGNTTISIHHKPSQIFMWLVNR